MANAIVAYVQSYAGPLLTPLILFGSIVAFGLFFRHLYLTFFGPLARIPGPRWRAFSILPHLHSMWRGTEAIDVHKLHQKYGPVVRLAPDLVAFVGEAHLWKQIYASKSHGVSTFAKDFLFYDKPFNNVNGPFTTDDANNMRIRKTMAPAFSEQGLRQYEGRFKGWCEALHRSLEQQAKAGTGADMVKMFNCATFDVMSDMLLSEPLHMLEKGDYVPFVHLIFTILRHVTRLKTLRFFNRSLGWTVQNLMMSIPSVRAHAEKHHKFVCDRVDERLAKSPAEPDIWSLVTADTSLASQISDEERYSIANELMIAGTETSATTLSGVLYYLLRNPEWISALTKDIRAQYQDIESVTMASLQANKLLDAVLKEGLRMYPPVPVGFPRFVPQGGVELKGYYIPEGARVAGYQLATYRDERLWREPESFRPERWLGDEKFKDDHLEALEPFSLGIRACPGKNFAWHEMRLILATVLLEFDFELRPESRDWAVDQRTFLVWEKGPLYVNLKKRAA